MVFSRNKHYLELYITDTALKVSRSLYCFTTSISHGVENYFPRLRGTGISDAIFSSLINAVLVSKIVSLDCGVQPSTEISTTEYKRFCGLLVLQLAAECRGEVIEYRCGGVRLVCSPG